MMQGPFTTVGWSEAPDCRAADALCTMSDAYLRQRLHSSAVHASQLCQAALASLYEERWSLGQGTVAPRNGSHLSAEQELAHEGASAKSDDILAKVIHGGLPHAPYPHPASRVYWMGDMMRDVRYWMAVRVYAEGMRDMSPSEGGGIKASFAILQPVVSKALEDTNFVTVMLGRGGRTAGGRNDAGEPWRGYEGSHVPVTPQASGTVREEDPHVDDVTWAFDMTRLLYVDIALRLNRVLDAKRVLVLGRTTGEMTADGDGDDSFTRESTQEMMVNLFAALDSESGASSCTTDAAREALLKKMRPTMVCLPWCRGPVAGLVHLARVHQRLGDGERAGLLSLTALVVDPFTFEAHDILSMVGYRLPYSRLARTVDHTMCGRGSVALHAGAPGPQHGEDGSFFTVDDEHARTGNVDEEGFPAAEGTPALEDDTTEAQCDGDTAHNGSESGVKGVQEVEGNATPLARQSGMKHGDERGGDSTLLGHDVSASASALLSPSDLSVSRVVQTRSQRCSVSEGHQQSATGESVVVDLVGTVYGRRCRASKKRLVGPHCGVTPYSRGGWGVKGSGWQSRGVYTEWCTLHREYEDAEEVAAVLLPAYAIVACCNLNRFRDAVSLIGGCNLADISWSSGSAAVVSDRGASSSSHEMNIDRMKLNVGLVGATPFLLCVLSRAQLALGAVTAAHASLSYVHELAPAYLPAYSLFATTLWHERDQDTLGLIAAAAAKIDSLSPCALLTASSALSSLGDGVGAIRALLRAIMVDPECLEALLLLGLEYCNMGEYGLAVKMFRRALHVDSRCVNAWYGLALVYNAAAARAAAGKSKTGGEESSFLGGEGSLALAITHIDRALSLSGESPSLHYVRAVMQLSLLRQKQTAYSVCVKQLMLGANVCHTNKALFVGCGLGKRAQISLMGTDDEVESHDASDKLAGNVSEVAGAASPWAPVVSGSGSRPKSSGDACFPHAVVSSAVSSMKEADACRERIIECLERCVDNLAEDCSAPVALLLLARLRIEDGEGERALELIERVGRVECSLGTAWRTSRTTVRGARGSGSDRNGTVGSANYRRAHTGTSRLERGWAVVPQCSEQLGFVMLMAGQLSHNLGLLSPEPAVQEDNLPVQSRLAVQHAVAAARVTVMTTLDRNRVMQERAVGAGRHDARDPCQLYGSGIGVGMYGEGGVLGGSLSDAVMNVLRASALDSIGKRREAILELSAVPGVTQQCTSTICPFLLNFVCMGTFLWIFPVLR